MAAKKSSKPSNVVAQSRRKKGGSSFSSAALWENVKGILGAVLLFFFIRAFFFEAYRIPSGSMIPSMLVGVGSHGWSTCGGEMKTAMS